MAALPQTLASTDNRDAGAIVVAGSARRREMQF
jgi:hypothetical protein